MQIKYAKLLIHFKGVKVVAEANIDELENISILKACVKARKTPKVSEDEILNALK